MPRRTKALFALAAALTGLAAFTCLRIEIFNWRAGGLQPRSADVDFGISTWRAAATSMVRQTMEERFRKEVELTGRPQVITEVQQEEIEQAVERARANARFLEFVASWGLGQYIVAPLALLLGLALTLDRKRSHALRWIGAAGATIAAGCVVMMIYRGYWSSLGW